MNRKKPAPAVPVPAWVRMPREVLSSDAWRSLGINGRRFIDFLMIELAGTAGTQNGKLKAPHNQLVTFGIGKRYVADAIRQAEGLGLVECHRGGQRVISTFALTWLPLFDGAPALDYWRGCRNFKLRPLSKPKPQNLPRKGRVSLPLKGEADGPSVPLNGGADGPKTLPLKGRDLSRKNLSMGGSFFSKEVRVAPPAPVPVHPPAAGNLRLVKAAAGGIAPPPAARGDRS